MMSAERDAFIAKYSQDVIDAVCGTGIFPSVAMAQMIIESANSQGQAGQGITAVKANNFFGIKASSAWTGQTMSFNTPNDAKPVRIDDYTTANDRTIKPFDLQKFYDQGKPITMPPRDKITWADKD